MPHVYAEKILLNSIRNGILQTKKIDDKPDRQRSFAWGATFLNYLQYNLC